MLGTSISRYLRVILGQFPSSLIIGDLDHRCEVHTFLPNFSNSSNPFTLQGQSHS